jgi:hypothetical protein
MTRRRMVFMKHAAEMSSGAMIYILSFRKSSSAIQNFGKGVTQTYRQQGDRINVLLFY